MNVANRYYRLPNKLIFEFVCIKLSVVVVFVDSTNFYEALYRLEWKNKSRKK